MSEKEKESQKVANAINEVATSKDKNSNKKAKQEPKKPVAVKPLVHIDSFIEAVTNLDDYTLSSMQISGFKAYMVGNHYMQTLQEFIPYLDKYLGRKEDN